MPSIAVETEFGRIVVTERDGAIVRVRWTGREEREPTPLLQEAARQIAAYAAGELRDFDLPLAPGVEGLNKQVSDAMLAIPYGRTRTYGEIANELGTFGQPVGQACASNPIPILIPCHRVLSAEGLGGYSGQGGIETKIALLRHEGGYPFLL